MLSVSDALQRIAAQVRPTPVVQSDLLESLGCVLASDIVATLDSPPFDKALMDGYAIRAADLKAGQRDFPILEEVTAGRVPQQELKPGFATRIMTGAMLPVGADAVVRFEDTQVVAGADSQSNECVRLNIATVRPDQNILRRGTSMRAGTRVLPAGRCLRPQELAALAEMGQARVAIYRRPSVAVLATGDELVEVHQQPGPGQIRNTNETMLVAQLRRCGCDVHPLGIARDNREDLRAKLQLGLQHDVLLLSGGVSAGTLDLVPSELQHAGVQQIFHKVDLKPGKPLWFGNLQASYVFGLPGNPVSSMVCFELFVRTALRALLGQTQVLPTHEVAQLTHDHNHKDDRETHFPAAIWSENGSNCVRLMKWHGSADLQSTVEANGVAIFPPTPTEYAAGTQIVVMKW